MSQYDNLSSCHYVYVILGHCQFDSKPSSDQILVSSTASKNHDQPSMVEQNQVGCNPWMSLILCDIPSDMEQLEETTGFTLRLSCNPLNWSNTQNNLKILIFEGNETMKLHSTRSARQLV